MRTTEEVINLIVVNREWLSFIPCQWSFLDKAPSIQKKTQTKKKFSNAIFHSFSYSALSCLCNARFFIWICCDAVGKVLLFSPFYLLIYFCVQLYFVLPFCEFFSSNTRPAYGVDEEFMHNLCQQHISG